MPQWVPGFLCIFCVVWASWRASAGQLGPLAPGWWGMGQGVALSWTAAARPMGSEGVGGSRGGGKRAGGLRGGVGWSGQSRKTVFWTGSHRFSRLANKFSIPSGRAGFSCSTSTHSSDHGSCPESGPESVHFRLCPNVLLTCWILVIRTRIGPVPNAYVDFSNPLGFPENYKNSLCPWSLYFTNFS